MLFRQARQMLVVEAPAKVNLFLEILGKRSDGYHDLETLMVSVGMYDTLTFMEDQPGKIRLRCFEGSPVGASGPDRSTPLPEDGNNLVVRAAELLGSRAGVGQGVRIELIKRIPVAAGLAGGSSDAAATLVALNRFWNLRLNNDELARMAAELGSDVPFFLNPTAAAICRGRGEIIKPLFPKARLHFVIACPMLGLSTAAVFKRCTLPAIPRSVAPIVECLASGRLGEMGSLLYNALEPAAFELDPRVCKLKELLSRETADGCLMTGSGSACFALCANRRQARHIAGRLRSRHAANVFAVSSAL